MSKSCVLHESQTDNNSISDICRVVDQYDPMIISNKINTYQYTNDQKTQPRVCIAQLPTPSVRLVNALSASASLLLDAAICLPTRCLTSSKLPSIDGARRVASLENLWPMAGVSSCRGCASNSGVGVVW